MEVHRTNGATVRVLALSGSLREASSNTRLLRAAAKRTPADMTLSLFDGIDALPHFSPDREDPLPTPVARWRAAIADADAIVISCPEYARAVPGAFKNALDWLVGGAEIQDKPVALFNASPRASHAQRSLEIILETIGARRIEAACLTVPLLGQKLDIADMLASDELARSIRHALGALRDAVRASPAASPSA